LIDMAAQRRPDRRFSWFGVRDAEQLTRSSRCSENIEAGKAAFALPRG